jgi:hypothetical protein
MLRPVQGTTLVQYVGFEVLTAVVMKSTIFWDITPCSPLKVKLCLPLAFTLVSCSAYSSTLKMLAICSSETVIDFQRTTRRYIPEESILLLFSSAVLNRLDPFHWCDLVVDKWDVRSRKLITNVILKFIYIWKYTFWKEEVLCILCLSYGFFDRMAGGTHDANGW